MRLIGSHAPEHHQLCAPRIPLTPHASPAGHFLEVVFPAGSGYSDMHLLPSSDAGDLIGVAFQKCDDVHQRQTSGMSMGWALVRVPPPPSRGTATVSLAQ